MNTYTPQGFPAPVERDEHGTVWCAGCPLTPAQALELAEAIGDDRVWRTEDGDGPHYVPLPDGMDHAELEGRPMAWSTCETLMQALVTASRVRPTVASLEVAQRVEEARCLAT